MFPLKLEVLRGLIQILSQLFKTNERLCIFVLKCPFISHIKDFRRGSFICYFVNLLRINIDQWILILKIWDRIHMSWCLKHSTTECSETVI